jgi:hypothetical protein
MTDLEALAERFNTVAAFYHDAYAEWQVSLDRRRATQQDCEFHGWGSTLAEAVAQALSAERQAGKPPQSKPRP